MKGLEKYEAKILIAWGEAISGNKKIRSWLVKNGYPELSVFCYALCNQDDARQWLMDNNFPHLMALINGIERNEQALNWLGSNGFYLLRNMAMAADGSEASMDWLQNMHPVFGIIAGKMYTIKKQIDDDNYDPHKINF